MLAIAKSRSVIVGVVPAGSVTFEMWIVSLMSVPVEVDDDLLRDVAGGHHQLDLGRTSVRTPPRAGPGDLSRLTYSTGM